MNTKQIKLVSATVGAGALFGMGAIAVASGGAGETSTDMVQPVAQEVTTTRTAAPDVVATPPITTPPFTIPTGEPQ